MSRIQTVLLSSGLGAGALALFVLPWAYGQDNWATTWIDETPMGWVYFGWGLVVVAVMLVFAALIGIATNQKK